MSLVPWEKKLTIERLYAQGEVYEENVEPKFPCNTLSVDIMRSLPHRVPLPSLPSPPYQTITKQFRKDKPPPSPAFL